MRSKHSSDERLLALLDGELRAWDALRVRGHLHSCWDCRARLTRLEATAHKLAESKRRSQFLPSQRIELARARFDAAIRIAPPAPAMPRSAWRRAAAIAATAVLSVTAAVGVWRTSVKPDSLQQPSAPTVVISPAAPTPAPSPAQPVRVPSHNAAIIPLPAPVVTAPAAGIDEETAVWFAIHQHGLCRGQTVRVAHRDGQFYISGVIANGSHREELIASLKQFSFPVVMELQTVEEASTRVANSHSSVATTDRVARVTAPGEALLHEWLRRQGVTQNVSSRASEIANLSVSTADLAWSEAWAIRDIANRFGSAIPTLSETGRTRVLTMLREHSIELRALAARQRQLLGELLPPAATTAPDLNAAASQWNVAIQQLFAPAEAVSTEATVLLQQIASSLQFIETATGEDTLR